MKRISISAFLILLVLLTLLVISHARPQEFEDPCALEHKIRAKQFALDYNRHLTTFEAKIETRNKTHEKLDGEWQALRALSCW